jgi:hypothetical protein
VRLHRESSHDDDAGPERQRTGSGDDARRVRRDPRERPADPAGTQPKHDPATLVPARALPSGALADGVVEGDAVEVGEARPGDGDGGDLLPQRRETGAVGAAAPPKAPPPHSPRFHFLYGALAALAAAAVAAAVVALAGSGGGSSSDGRVASWSTWKPTRGALSGAGQIAGHIGPRYRLDGRQLVSVEASGLSFEGIPLAVAIRQTAAQGGDIRIFDDGGLIYRLCGLGQNCSISTGKASPQRHLLLRREALELALYSFRYLDGIDQVVVLMPPAPGQKPSQAVFFRRADVKRQLAHPLTASLAQRTPTVRTIRVSRDAPLVDRLTGVHLFTFSLTQANTENRGFLVLDPITAQTAGKQPAQKQKRPQKGK